MPISPLVLAWLEEATTDLLAGKILMEAGFHSQAVYLSQQAAAKAFKSLLQEFQIPEGSGLHPSALFEELLKKPAGAPLKAFEGKLHRSLKAYRVLESDGNAARFPKLVENRVIAPKKECKGIHAVKALTVAREIIGLCEAFFKLPPTTSACR